MTDAEIDTLAREILTDVVTQVREWDSDFFHNIYVGLLLGLLFHKDLIPPDRIIDQVTTSQLPHYPPQQSVTNSAQS